MNEAENTILEESSNGDEPVSESGLADEVNNTEETNDNKDIDEDKNGEENTEKDVKNNDNKSQVDNKNDDKEHGNKSEEDKIADNKDDVFDKESGRFNTGFFGELQYDSDALKENQYITDGMKNPDPSKATKSLSNSIRSEIQENAIESKLSEDKDYFKQFGCDKKTPSTIRSWFSESKDYTLHETKEHTIQIMDAKVHRSTHHDGGVSQEKSEMISADSKSYNSSNYEDNLWWMKK